MNSIANSCSVSPVYQCRSYPVSTTTTLNALLIHHTSAGPSNLDHSVPITVLAHALVSVQPSAWEKVVNHTHKHVHTCTHILRTELIEPLLCCLCWIIYFKDPAVSDLGASAFVIFSEIHALLFYVHLGFFNFVCVSCFCLYCEYLSPKYPYKPHSYKYITRYIF